MTVNWIEVITIAIGLVSGLILLAVGVALIVAGVWLYRRMREAIEDDREEDARRRRAEWREANPFLAAFADHYEVETVKAFGPKEYTSTEICGFSEVALDGNGRFDWIRKPPEMRAITVPTEKDLLEMDRADFEATIDRLRRIRIANHDRPAHAITLTTADGRGETTIVFDVPADRRGLLGVG